MSVGASIFLIAVGAILYFATSFRLADVNIDTVGIILMAAGAVGLLISLLFMANRQRDPDVYVEERRDPRRPPR